MKPLCGGRRIALVTLLLPFAACPPPPVPPTPTSFSVNIRFRDVDNSEQLGVTFIQPVATSSGCEFRLEFNDPNQRPDNALHQIGGTPPLEEFTLPSCSSTAPDFVATAANPSHFEQQTAYFWAFLARDYARRRLWLPSNRINLSKTRIELTVTSASEFKTACYVPPPHSVGNACMRDWGGEGPRIYLLEGAVNAFDIVHEFGHYAGGYVFGYMDTAGLNGYDITQCSHRSFQETLADLFKELFFHDRSQPFPVAPGDGAQWVGGCSGDDHNTGLPLIQAFNQALVGTDPSGTITVPWPSPAEANRAMAAAVHFSLALKGGHSVSALANGIVHGIETNEPPVIADAVKRIFHLHRLSLGLGEEECSDNTQCLACVGDNCNQGRCDTTVRPQRCIPPDGAGVLNEYCTHNNHCQSGRCNLSTLKCQM